MPTSGKVLRYYFIEVPTWHHTRELPYWCGGCQSTETEEEEKKLHIGLILQNDRSCTAIILCTLWERGDYAGGKTSADC